MNSAKKTKKKISEYQIEDIKEIFLNLLKKISSKIILLEIGNDFLNIALAKSQKNRNHKNARTGDHGGGREPASEVLSTLRHASK